MNQHLSWICVFIAIITGIVAKTSEKPLSAEGTLKAALREAIRETIGGVWQEEETENSYWQKIGRDALNRRLPQNPNNVDFAKNVIFFMGDGMSIPTLTAARIYAGQLNDQPGEEGSLYWENFRHTGLVKTYCIDAQVGDSACSATAYLGGVKSKFMTLGLNGKVKRGWCKTQTEENYVHSILKWAQDHGKATGIVTTTRVTDASPAGAYAHVAHRKWETDTDMRTFWKDDSENCLDIATQLVRTSPGKDFKVIFGGGRRNFLPKTTMDEEGIHGYRSDGKNLIEAWKREEKTRCENATYIWSKSALDDVKNNPDSYDCVLGLFESSHFPYHLDDKSEKNPTLLEMTAAAIKIVQKEKKGYFLFIEGGRIDDAHRENYAKIALDETVELSKAVEKAAEMTSAEDTLIIVTADHGHTMHISGYARRGDRITGVSAIPAPDGIPYQTLSYATGPGYRKSSKDGKRYDPTTENTDDDFYRSPALIPRDEAAHGGEDVAIFAHGPWANLFTGFMEQSDIPYFLGYASCIGEIKAAACSRPSHNPNPRSRRTLHPLKWFQRNS